MKPNIFQHKSTSNEDHFTHSLCYLLNLFPADLGNRLLAKIARMAGYSDNYFGKFVSAEFTGYEYQNYDSTSKPDMVINTSKTKIFFENKLSAPLSKTQMERHLKVVKPAKGKLIFVSQVQTSISDTILKSKFYVKPKNKKHFEWADFEPVFNKRLRKGTLGEKLLSDFKTGFRSNGMRGRTIIGADDNLYTNGSAAENLFLDSLQELLRVIGFKAWRGRHEFTLRVNPRKAGEFPLFNPRLYSSGEWLDDSMIQECLIVSAISGQGNKVAIKKIANLRKLEKLHKGVQFIEFDHMIDDKYYLAAEIYIPLNFTNSGKNSDINWTPLRKVWQSIFELMQKE